MTPIEAAAALNAISIVDVGVPMHPLQLNALLYYAQGFSLATDGERLFEGTFVPRTQGFVIRELEKVWASGKGGWPWLRPEFQPTSLEEVGEEASRHLRDIVAVFGGWNFVQFASAVRAERPWQDSARTVGYGKDPRGEVNDRVIHAYFAEMTEGGEDAMAELGISREPDRAWWVKPYELAVNLKRLVGHPFFDDAESRRLRTEMGLHEFPGSATDADETSGRLLANG